MTQSGRAPHGLYVLRQNWGGLDEERSHALSFQHAPSPRRSRPGDRSAADRDAAAAAYRRAIEIAREQQARLLELRAATSLAQLWAENGKRDAARAMLAPVYQWFTEGFDKPDLRDAKALLDELA